MDPLFRAPNMYGNSFFTRGQVLGMTPSTHGGVIDIPGSHRTKVAENHSTLPQDRGYFMYQHFHNAIRAQDFSWEVPGYANRKVDFEANRYTVGVEKTFLDGTFSVDVRIPFQDATRFEASPWPLPNFLFTAASDSSSIGNIALTLKGLLHASETSAVSAGLTADLPTGPDVDGSLYFRPFRMENESVHLEPFLSALYCPNETWFCQGVLQVDIDATGSRLLNSSNLFGTDLTEVGRLQDQTALYLDVSGGRWLYQNPCNRFLSGLAGLVELHYTTTLQDADTVSDGTFWGLLAASNFANRVDILDLTTGLHFQFGEKLRARLAVVAPLLRAESDRSFDFEVGAQVNWLF